MRDTTVRNMINKVKCHVAFKTTFFRDKCFSGQLNEIGYTFTPRVALIVMKIVGGLYFQNILTDKTTMAL